MCARSVNLGGGACWELSNSWALSEIGIVGLKSQYLWKSFPESLLFQQPPWYIVRITGSEITFEL